MRYGMKIYMPVRADRWHTSGLKQHQVSTGPVCKTDGRSSKSFYIYLFIQKGTIEA